jgi:2-dehydropantoate 2-reductase
MRVIVFGAGAIGSLFGARIATGGHDVLLVSRPAHAAAIHERGLRIEGRTQGVFRIPCVERLPPHPEADALLITVKSFDLGSAASELGNAVQPEVPALALQNGLGVERTAVEGLEAGGWKSAADFVVRGINSVPATLVSPGVVRHAGDGEVLLGGAEPGRGASAVTLFSRLFQSANIPARPAGDLPLEVWRKVVVNAAINPVTADLGILNGQLTKDPWRGQALNLLREAVEVAQAEGFDLSIREAERDLWKVVRNTAENRSSMLQDLDHGRPTEVDAISNSILELGQRHGLSLPMTARMVERIRRRVDRSLPPPRP